MSHLDPNELLSCLLDDLLAATDLPVGWSEEMRLKAFALQHKALLSKFEDASGEPSQAAKDAATKKFVEVNQRSETHVTVPVDDNDRMALGEMKSFLWRLWNSGYSTYDDKGYRVPLVGDLMTLFDLGGPGPGSSRKNRAPDTYTKMFDGPITSSKGLADVWPQICSYHPRFNEAESLRDQRYGSMICQSSLFHVSKNVKIARTCATEPSVNMWLQKGFGSALARGLKNHLGLDISKQQAWNRALARAGSVNERFITLDLESASDSISCSLAAQILPKDMWGYIKLLRSESVELPNGSVVKLGMVSSMGNGFTFPLQTAIFASIVAAAYRILGLTLRFRPDMKLLGKGLADDGLPTAGVYGDDIIVVPAAGALVLRILGMCGFTVNRNKSYVEGAFRESCGGDYFDGKPVRAFYLKGLNSLQDLFIAINGLLSWSVRTDVTIPRTISYLVSGLPEGYIKRDILVPPDEVDDSGIKAPLVCVELVDNTPLAKHKLTTYKASVPSPDNIRVWDWGMCVSDRELRKKRPILREHNPEGLYLCFLHGSVKGHAERSKSKTKPHSWVHEITVREPIVTYALKDRKTPSWDWIPPDLTPREALVERAFGFLPNRDLLRWPHVVSEALLPFLYPTE